MPGPILGELLRQVSPDIQCMGKIIGHDKDQTSPLPVRGGGRDALSYGVSFATTDRNSWLRGLRRAFSPAFSGWLYPLIPWRVGAEESGAAKYGSMASAAPSPI